MIGTSIRSVRRRPLLVIGEMCRQVDVSGDGAVASRVGGLGYDVTTGVDLAGGTCRSSLLASAGVHTNFGSVERRRIAVSTVDSKNEFEIVRSDPAARLRACNGPGPTQIIELQRLIASERPAVRGSHTHFAGLGLSAMVTQEEEPLTGASGSVSCADVEAFEPRHLRRLPDLLFLDCDRAAAAESCPAVTKIRGNRALVHFDSGGVTVIVDGISALALGQGVGRHAGRRITPVGRLVGAALTGLGSELSLEEAVATSFWLGAGGDQAAVPSAVAAMEPDARAARVLRLMKTGTAGHDALQDRLAVALLVVRDGLLLVGTKPAEKAFVPGRLYLPGGKLKQGETPSQAARRELREETGLTVDTLDICGYSCYERDRQLYEFVQYLATASGQPKAQDDMATLEWRDASGLARESLFDLTWAQLLLLRGDRMP